MITNLKTFLKKYKLEISIVSLFLFSIIFLLAIVGPGFGINILPTSNTTDLETLSGKSKDDLSLPPSPRVSATPKPSNTPTPTVKKTPTKVYVAPSATPKPTTTPTSTTAPTSAPTNTPTDTPPTATLEPPTPTQEPPTPTT